MLDNTSLKEKLACGSNMLNEIKTQTEGLTTHVFYSSATTGGEL